MFFLRLLLHRAILLPTSIPSGLFFLWFFLCFRYLGPSYFQLAADPLTSKFQWASCFYGFSYVFAILGHLTSNLSPTCLQDAILLAKLPPRWLQVASKTSGGGPLGCPLCQTTVLKVFAFIQDGRFLSDPVACNMSPLGRRRGPALRA